MTENFRTSLSAVYWTTTPEEAQQIADDAKLVIPEIDREATLTTVEYREGGRPEPLETQPVAPPEEPA